MFAVATTNQQTPSVTADSLDDYPELATNEHWRGLMKAKRQAKEMNQTELAARVGVSQNVISKIENGEQLASKAIMPICNVLKIPPPMAVFEDELDQRWYEAGRRLRAIDPKVFRSILVGAEAQLTELLEQLDQERNT